MLATGSIDLISGGVVFVDDIRFDDDSYHFTLASTGDDITEDLYRKDKIDLVGGFDTSKENQRVSRERGAGSTPGWSDNSPTTTVGVLEEKVQETGNLFDLNAVIDGWLDAGKETVKAGNEALQNAAKNAGAEAGKRIVPFTALLLIAGAAVYFYLRRK